MNEETVSIDTDGAKLEGTLSIPSEQAVRQAVLLVAGSGPLDRNQNSGKFKLNIFNEVAAHLAANGIASLRYDKRGCGNSQGDYNSAGHYDLVHDAYACVQILKDHPAVTNAPVYLLGHSEGTLIAPQVISMDDDIAGQILLTPYLEDFEKLLRRQAEMSLAEIAALPGFKGVVIRFFLRVSGDQLAKQKKLISRIQNTSEATIKLKKQVINAKWFRELIEIDAYKIHSAIVAPTLAIGGEKDVQCLPGDTEKLKHIVNGPIETHIIKDLTHILRRDPKDPSTQHYSELASQPIDEELLNLVSSWLKKQPART